VFSVLKEWKLVGNGLEFDLIFLYFTYREARINESQTHKRRIRNTFLSNTVVALRLFRCRELSDEKQK